MNKSPVVSVIIPVYNAEPFLSKCLDSLLSQTFRDYEVICVDDGSSDGSVRILRDYAERDPRFIVYVQDHGFAGSARNLGMSMASGCWLLFLDADDRFVPDMLETAVGKAEISEADICVFGADVTDFQTGKVSQYPGACCPTMKQGDVFSPDDDPDHIFSFTNLPAWNKLIRKDHIEKNGLRFTNYPNSNDLTFVMTLLATAHRITTVKRPLIHCRVNRPDSLQGSKESAPLAFYDALLETQKELTEKNLYKKLERPFINQAAAVIFYNLLSAKTDASFEGIFGTMHESGINALNLNGRDDGFFYPVRYESYAEMVRLIEKGSAEDFAAEFQVSAPGYRDMKKYSAFELIRALIRRLGRR